MHRQLLAAVLVATTTGHTRAQSPAFEVATIKRNTSGSTSSSNRLQPGGRISATNSTLRNIIRNVYRVQEFQLVGGPDWLSTDRWDIVAKASGDPSPEQMMEMAKTLLADRFKLVVRRERRDTPIYALVLDRPDGRLGPKLLASTTDCQAIIA